MLALFEEEKTKIKIQKNLSEKYPGF